MKKVALIVGGSGGIGKYLVKVFSEAGNFVVFTYNHGEEQANALLDKYSGTFAIRVDSTKEEDIEECIRYIKNEYGSLDIIVYAAGVFEDALVNNTQLDSWNRVLSINLTAPFLYAKYGIELLRKSGNGRFVCIGSVMGDLGTYGSCSYAASKAGLIGLVKSIALENARYGVTANVVSYGYIDAGMTNQVPDNVLEAAKKKIPMQRLGNPVDAARIVLDICQEHCNYISGQVIRNNGMMYV